MQNATQVICCFLLMLSTRGLIDYQCKFYSCSQYNNANLFTLLPILLLSGSSELIAMRLIWPKCPILKKTIEFWIFPYFYALQPNYYFFRSLIKNGHATKKLKNANCVSCAQFTIDTLSRPIWISWCPRSTLKTGFADPSFYIRFSLRCYKRPFSATSALLWKYDHLNTAGE